MTVLTEPADVAAFCDRLGAEPFVAVDTEFMRERTYWSRLCLVQLAGRDEAAAIDPMAEGVGLQPLFDLLADPAVLKVFHAARQDLEIFYHLTGEVPHPVFDTQVAAMVCGFGDQIGYEAIVRRATGRRVDKDSRFTDWSRRPLTGRQIAYALADVTHLRKVYETIAAMLGKNGRAAWIDEEMAVLTGPDTYRVDTDRVWRKIRMKGRKPRQLAALRELARWREETAQRRDVPRNRVVKDDVLAQIALHMPKSAGELGAVRLVPRGMERGGDGRDMLAAVGRALALPDDELPDRDLDARPAAEAPASLVDLMKALLRVRCEREGVAPRLVASASDIERFAAGDERESPLAHGWRHEVFGRDARRLREGELALAPDGDGLRLVAL